MRAFVFQQQVHLFALGKLGEFAEGVGHLLVDGLRVFHARTGEDAHLVTAHDLGATQGFQGVFGAALGSVLPSVSREILRAGVGVADGGERRNALRAAAEQALAGVRRVVDGDAGAV